MRQDPASDCTVLIYYLLPEVDGGAYFWYKVLFS